SAAPAASGGGKGKSDKSDKADKSADKSEDAAPAESAAPAAAAAETDGLDLSDTKDKNVDEAGAAAVRASSTLSWQDIVVVPRKRFLKAGRFEFAPFSGVSLNDILIRHYVFGLDLNYFLSNAMWVGLQGNYYVKALTEREELLGLQYNRIPTLNRYLYGGSVNFGYAPIYGKFALFNSSILHWEIYASAGVGITQTEIIPRIPGDATFTNMSITPNGAIGGRFFLFDSLTVNYAVRDYVVLDKFENTNRPANQSGAAAKSAAEGKMVHNVMFYVGIGLYLPTKFQYKTPR
ncbi:MAG: outer membrane beta-barrel domain-containing protein, partial [Deltaproteobacteria bacterium]|nr:outer membrane beta-barrel domain-containing protein [Deltaproteobacteria bacterium]